MILKIDFNSDTAIYLQIKNQIIINIGKGNVLLGERLPTVRQMAEDLGVNPMTVNKAYAQLKQEGIIEIDRRKGVSVKKTIQEDNAYTEQLQQELLLAITKGKFQGLTDKKIEEILRENINGIKIKGDE